MTLSEKNQKQKGFPEIDVSKLTDFEVSLLIIERDVCQYKRERIDELLNKIGEAKGFVEAKEESGSEPLIDDSVYAQFNWEHIVKEGRQYDVLKRDNVNNLQLYNHLLAMLKQNKNNLYSKDFHYWCNQDGTYIFRRQKQKSKQ